MFAAINRERRSHRVGELVWDDRLAALARRHSERMVQRKFFSHTDPEWGDVSNRLDRAKIAWQACAENIYQEQGLADPVRAAVQGWLSSPGHRKNMLSRAYGRSGLGVAIERDGKVTVTQVFVGIQ